MDDDHKAMDEDHKVKDFDINKEETGSINMLPSLICTVIMYRHLKNQVIAAKS